MYNANSHPKQYHIFEVQVAFCFNINYSIYTLNKSESHQPRASHTFFLITNNLFNMLLAPEMFLQICCTFLQTYHNIFILIITFYDLLHGQCV